MKCLHTTGQTLFRGFCITALGTIISYGLVLTANAQAIDCVDPLCNEPWQEDTRIVKVEPDHPACKVEVFYRWRDCAGKRYVQILRYQTVSFGGTCDELRQCFLDQNLLCLRKFSIDIWRQLMNVIFEQDYADLPDSAKPMWECPNGRRDQVGFFGECMKACLFTHPTNPEVFGASFIPCTDICCSITRTYCVYPDTGDIEITESEPQHSGGTCPPGLPESRPECELGTTLCFPFCDF